LKITLIVQDALAASELPQVLVWVKSFAFEPATAIELIVRVELPLLVSVTGDEEELDPGSVAGNDTLLTDNIAPGPTPVPVSGIT